MPYKIRILTAYSLFSAGRKGGLMQVRAKSDSEPKVVIRNYSVYNPELVKMGLRLWIRG